MNLLMLFLLNLLVLALALLLDLIFGEPPEQVHPTVWMGRSIARFASLFKNRSSGKMRIAGVFLCVICVGLFTIPTIGIVAIASKYLGTVGYVVVSAIILKTSFALKSWDLHAIPVAQALESKRIEDARRICQKSVRRDLSKADDEHVISANVETIAEGVVDGYSSPIFYFALFSTPGAIAYRVINTLDSMVGYKDQTYRDLGWFSAKMDTIANYLPARITGYTIVLASALVGENWKRSKAILERDRRSIESPNAGWPMSAMAGALGLRLEKIGYYSLGDLDELPSPDHIYRALKIMRATCTLFTIVVALPLMYGTQLIQKLVTI